jgi:predicted Zn-dependent protease
VSCLRTGTFAAALLAGFAGTAEGFPPEDRMIGEREHPKLVSNFGGVYRGDPVLHTYIDELGTRLARQSRYGGQEWTFTVLDTPAVNAFALPGGYVYLTRGLVALARSESDLGAALAHEIAHVAAHHGRERHARTAAANAAPGGAGDVLGRDESDGRPVEFERDVILARYSQQDEFEADALGIGYLQEAGLDPVAVVRMLEANEAHAELVGIDSEAGAQMLSSHPSTPERMSRATILSRRLAAESGRGPEDRFLDHIDGLHFGSRPRTGLVRGQEVLLAGTEVRFRMPDGFHIRREPGRVTARAMDGTLIVYDEIGARWGSGILSYLPRGSREVELLRLDGMDAATGIRNPERGGQRFEYRTLVIQCATGLICRFRYIVPMAVSLARLADLRATAFSFRRFDAQDREMARQKMIRVVTVTDSDTLASLIARMEVGATSKRWFELLNGLQPGEMPAVGRRVKLVVREGR